MPTIRAAAGQIPGSGPLIDTYSDLGVSVTNRASHVAP
jgi:hypothetical protein